MPLTTGEGVGLQTFGQAYDLAEMIAQSGFAPKGMESPKALTIAIAFGAELGLTPLAAIQNIAPINNRPTLWGNAMLAVVMRSGNLEDIQETMENSDKEGPTAVCTVKRKGIPTPKTQKFSRWDAENAGLWGRNVWKAYPKRMLQMRARSLALNDAFPDMLKGMYSTEELMGGAPPMSTPVETANIEDADWSDVPELNQVEAPPAELSDDDIVAELFKAAKKDLQESASLIGPVLEFFHATAEANETPEVELLDAAKKNIGRFWAKFEARYRTAQRSTKEGQGERSEKKAEQKKPAQDKKEEQKKSGSKPEKAKGPALATEKQLADLKTILTRKKPPQPPEEIMKALAVYDGGQITENTANAVMNHMCVKPPNFKLIEEAWKTYKNPTLGGNSNG